MSDSSEISIKVQCPVEGCSIEKEIQIPQYLFENKRMHLLKIPIHTGMCCEHEFIAFVSTKSYKIMGYEKIDTTVDLSQLDDSTEKEQLTLQDLLGKYSTLATSSILMALILDKPIVLLRTKYEKNLSTKLVNLLMKMIPSEDQKTLLGLKHLLDTEFKKAKIKNSLVISPNGVVANTPWQRVPDTIFREILNNALEILDSSSQTVLIQNELSNILNQAEFIVKQISKGDIFEDELIKKLEKTFSMKITNSHLKVLKLIVSERFNKNPKKIKIRSFSKLKEGLW